MNNIKTAMIVEDDENQREIMKIALQSLGWHVIEAENKKAFEEVFRTLGSSQALFIFDGRLGDGLGWELAPKVRVKYPDVPIILRSGEPEQKEIVDCVAALNTPSAPCIAIGKGAIKTDPAAFRQSLDRLISETETRYKSLIDFIYPNGEINFDWRQMSGDKDEVEARKKEANHDLHHFFAAELTTFIREFITNIEQVSPPPETPLDRLRTVGSIGRYRPASEDGLRRSGKE